MRENSLVSILALTSSVFISSVEDSISENNDDNNGGSNLNNASLHKTNQNLWDLGTYIREYMNVFACIYQYSHFQSAASID